MTTEIMDRQAEDFVVCLCGNAPHLDGFFCADPDGTIRELGDGPEPEWDGDTMACFGCGRVFSLTTSVVSGRMTPEMLAGALAVDLPGSPVLVDAAARLHEEQGSRCASPDDIAFWKAEVVGLERQFAPCPECGGPADTGMGHDCEALLDASDDEITREGLAMAQGGLI